MEWELDQGDRIAYRCIGEDQVHRGYVRKAMRILTASLEAVNVYLVSPDRGDIVVVGDGEIVEKLTETV
jgi:hypothetical protein